MDSNTFETQSKTNIDASRDAPLTWTLASSRSKSNIINNVFERLKESWPYVLNPKYTTPTSLPLCFFFGYQLMQVPENKHGIEKCGHVGIFNIL